MFRLLSLLIVVFLAAVGTQVGHPAALELAHPCAELEPGAVLERDRPAPPADGAPFAPLAAGFLGLTWFDRDPRAVRAREKTKRAKAAERTDRVEARNDPAVIAAKGENFQGALATIHTAAAEGYDLFTSRGGVAGIFTGSDAGGGQPYVSSLAAGPGQLPADVAMAIDDAADTGKLIPGVDNRVTYAGGAGLLALAVYALLR